MPHGAEAPKAQFLPKGIALVHVDVAGHVPMYIGNKWFSQIASCIPLRLLLQKVCRLACRAASAMVR
jgi:hypothetical protein